MSERNTALLLSDILNAIDKILDYTADMEFEDYVNDSKTKDAVERNFEIIGEAAARVPENYKILHPEIEWRILKDFRNVIIHEYFGVDNLIVYSTIRVRLPELYRAVLLISKTSSNS